MKKRSSFQFKISENVLNFTDPYKYLRGIFNGGKTFHSNAENLAHETGPALGAIILKLHCMEESGIKTFETLYAS